MVTSIYSSSSSSRSPHTRGRLNATNDLPLHSPSRHPSPVRQHLSRHSPWWLRILVSIITTILLCCTLLNPRKFYLCTATRCGRKRGFYFICTSYLTLLFAVYALAHRFVFPAKEWPFINTSTLVYKRGDIQRIWKWEIASGHYPSRREIPEEIRLRATPVNPALPQARTVTHKKPKPYVTESRGVGAERVYPDIQRVARAVAYPPRPPPGSVIDFDIVMDHCDFSHQKFVRDCLEVLRVGAGLDHGKRMRRGNLDSWKYIYLEKGGPVNSSIARDAYDADSSQNSPRSDGLTRKRGAEWEKTPIKLPEPRLYQPYSTLPSPCDPENQRIFHMFWTGPFTDKPYVALISFLYTQNTGLHLATWPKDSKACRPKFWLWINPGPAAAVPNPSAKDDMLRDLRSNPWAAPFLHPRFQDVIEFKLWNTTEQLDAIPEIRDEWRKRDLFNSLGHAISVPRKIQKGVSQEQDFEDAEFQTEQVKVDDILHRAGSESSATYDKLSVILSDIARFVLCHRYGGIYLDADTVFLRDWEEIWGWQGAFAYRWSRLERYNTAVLHLNKGSALGTFLFKTALKNGMDFHPFSVTKYTKDAYLEGLLLRLPDALFDPAWLVSEGYQTQRPAQPYFTSFENFFDTPLSDSAAPQALGFDGFFRGAYSYHYHNYWWKPFDPARNWPDLGPRFVGTEKIARDKARKAGQSEGQEDEIENDKRDLDWATVMKRTCEAYIRGEIPNLYGEWLEW